VREREVCEGGDNRGVRRMEGEFVGGVGFGEVCLGRGGLVAGGAKVSEEVMGFAKEGGRDR